MKKNYLVLILSFCIPALIISCGKNQNINTGIDSLKIKTLSDSVQNSYTAKFSGYYQGTAKDAMMELVIENFDGKNFSGFNTIYWKSSKNGLRADYKGKYDKETRKIVMTEDEKVKGAGYFDGYYFPDENKIEGDWYRYSDNGSYKWMLRKSDQSVSGNQSEIRNQNNSETSTGKNFRHFICFGTEPFWTIEVTRQNITFENAGEKKVFLKYVDPEPAAGFTLEHMRIYNIDISKNIVLTIKPSNGGCSDNMSDELYPYEVTFQYKGRTYSGCAK